VGAVNPCALLKAYPKGRINSRIFPGRAVATKDTRTGCVNKLETADQFWYILSMKKFPLIFGGLEPSGLGE
jgi:hypothetical protein